MSILSICILGMAFVWVSTRLLFESSFLDYINKQNEQSIKLAAARLESYYDQHGSWQPLIDDRRIWRQLASGIIEEPFNNYRRPPRPNDLRPPPAREARRDARGPEGQREPGQRQQGPENRNNRRPPDEPIDRRRPPPRGELGTERQPLDMTLLDKDDNYVSGHDRLSNNLNLIRISIESNGQIVGYLLGRKQTRITEAVDQNFAESLNRSVMIVLAFSLVFTFFIATLLARHLSLPIKKLSSAAHELGKGNYEARMATDRSDEIGQLAEDFNHLARKLEANKYSQQRWVADISHELRTPLAILKGELMALEDGVRKLDTASLTSLINETERFSRLVNDLYDLSRADAGDLDYRMENLDLHSLLEDCVENFSAPYESKQIGLSIDVEQTEIVIQADAVRMMQLFTNLLENSLRYTDSGGKTQIKCKTTNSQVIISIEDTAPSVPASSLQKIFERLYRVETSRSRIHGGGGLGLSLCKSIVEAHQGDIQATQSVLGGLAITISLPRSTDTHSWLDLGE